MTDIGRAIDITGRKYGRLTVIERAPNGKGYKTRWLCQCECGNQTIVQGESLRTGATRSCGCLQKEWAQNHNSLPLGEAAFNSIYRAYQGSAHKRHLEFDLTRDQVRDLIDSRCHYCGSEPRKMRSMYHGHYAFNGIDRVDNARGYVIDNVVPCCYICNLAKKDMAYEDFIEYLDELVKYRSAMGGNHAD